MSAELRTKIKSQAPATTAHERARYRCFLPDLAGLAGKRRAEPMPDSTYYQEIAENRNGCASFRLSSTHTMSDSECAVYKKLKERETRAHTTWTSFLYRNEVKPKLSDKAKRKHQREEMEAYQQAHKARLAHTKTCPICKEINAVKADSS